MIYPLAPHFGSEKYKNYFNEEINNESWPKFNKEKLANPTYELVVQINGKTKKVIEMKRDTEENEIKTGNQEILNIRFEKKNLKFCLLDRNSDRTSFVIKHHVLSK